MSDLLKTFFIPTDTTSWIFFIWIFSVFGLSLFETSRHYWIRQTQVALLRKKIESISKPYRKSISDLEIELKGFALVVSAWLEFRGTLIPSEKTISSRVSFYEYFNVDALEPHKIFTPRVVASIPSTLTILGILGTFVSLVDGLTGLNLGGNPDQLQNGVRKLISSVNTAYVKSIWGVGCSVIFLALERNWSDRLRWKVECAAKEFDLLFEPLSSEHLLDKILHQQAEQTTTLKAFNTDLSDLIRSANAQVVDALGGVGDQMSAVARENSKSQEQALKDVLEDVVKVFREQMIGAVKAGMDELAGSLEAVAVRMETFGDEAGKMTEKLSKVTSDLTETQKDLGTAVSMVEETLLSLSETVSAAQTAAQQMQQTMESSANHQKSTADILAQFNAVAKQVGETVGALERCQKETDVMASKIAASVTSLDENFAEFTERFETVHNTLSNTAITFAQQVRSEVEKYCVTLDSSLSTASTSLSSVVKDMEDTLKHLPSVITRMQPNEKVIQEASALIAALKAWEIAQQSRLETTDGDS